jgi:DNA repair protein RAD57
LAHLPPSRPTPSLAKILTIPAKHLEEQDHILEFQLPVAVRRFNAGLVVLDSITAHYRAESGSGTSPRDLAARSAQLVKTGHILRRLAVEHDVAVVVANQVSDRFGPVPSTATMAFHELRTSSPASGHSSSPAPSHGGPTSNGTIQARAAVRDEVMTLDHQQHFFSGWGANAAPSPDIGLKTPALGLAWTNQIAARVVLKMEARPGTTATPADHVHDRGGRNAGLGGNLWHERKKRRFLSVVFAPWAAGGREVEFEIRPEGMVGVRGDEAWEGDGT